MNEKRLLAYFWIIFLARGFFYVSFLPLWEGFDEWAHYAVIQKVALGKELLTARGDRVSREIDASLKAAPWVDGPLSRDAYWQIPDSSRSNYEQTLRSMPVEWTRESVVAGPLMYEAQQAPLYYWLFAGAYRLMAGLPFLTRVWLLRCLSLLVGSSVIPAAFLLARRIFGSGVQALGVAALVAATPQLMMTITHIGNDSLSVTMGSFMLVVLFWWRDSPRSALRATALGVVFGLALLTKAYFLAFLPPLAIVLGLPANRKKSIVRQALIPVACSATLSAWWYVYTWTLTGSLSGEQTEIAGGRASLDFMAAALKMPWLQVIDFAFMSHLWLGNWSFLVVRSWMYHFFAVLAGLAMLGLIFSLLQRDGKLCRNDLLLLTGIYASFVAALGYHSVRGFQAAGSAGSLGYYLFPVIIAEAILVAAGLQSIAPAALQPAVVPGAVLCLSVLELFGIHFYAIPYYTGLTSHLPSGGLPALNMAHIRSDGVALMVRRLSVDKPEFLGPTAMGIIWILFLLATIALLVLVTSCATRNKGAAAATARLVQEKQSGDVRAGERRDSPWARIFGPGISEFPAEAQSPLRPWILGSSLGIRSWIGRYRPPRPLLDGLVCQINF